MAIEIAVAVTFAFVSGACAGWVLTVSVDRWRTLACVPAPVEIEMPAADRVEPQIAPFAHQPQTDAAPTPLRAASRRAVVVPMRPAEDHAAALLEFLQGPGGLVGEITAAEIEASYGDLMIDMQWHPRPWPTVAKALRAALGDAPKTYGYRNGQRVRIWRIPAATKSPAPLRKVA